MLLDMRDKETGDLVSRDVLDIDMALSIAYLGTEDKYCVSINKKYRDDVLFGTKAEAENRLKLISSARNKLESELREYE